MGNALVVELGIEGGFYDGISGGNIFGKLEGFLLENHLEKELDLREIPLMGSKKIMVMKNMRDNDW